MSAAPALSPAELARYSRHLLLAPIGLAGQGKLAAARVLVVGAGGLGSPAALYLAAAGVGTLGIADLDRVELHNLQRQLLHDDASLGESKVASAVRRLRCTNPHVQVVPHEGGITPANAVAIFSHYDVVVDGTDNFGSRYLNNDAAFFAHRPLVYGSVFQFEAQVTVFDPARGAPCYRCLFPAPPPSGAVPGCGEAGVLGALCGVIGSLQALEAIKLITGVGSPLRGRLLLYDSLAQEFRTTQLAADDRCPLCGRQPTIREVASTATEVGCGSAAPPTSAADFPFEVDVATAKQLRDAAPDRVLIVDVRESAELVICRLDGSRHVPLRQLPENAATLPRDKHLLLLCHVGARSRRATEYLRAHGFPAASNIAGGIDAWAREIDPGLRRY